MIHPSSRQGRPAKEVSNGSANDVCQSMKQSIVGRVPVLGTLVSNVENVGRIFFFATNPKKTRKLLKLDEFFGDSVIGKTFFSHHFGEYVIYVGTVSTDLKQIQEKGVGSTHPPSNSHHQSGLLNLYRESLYILICHSCWVGSRSNIRYFYHYLGKMNRF